MSKTSEKIKVANQIEKRLNGYYTGIWQVVCKCDTGIVDIYHNNYLRYQITIDNLKLDMSLTDLLNHKLDIGGKKPRVFVRWYEDANTIKEYYFDVDGTLQHAQEIAKHLCEVMDAKGTEYVSCYASLNYFI